MLTTGTNFARSWIGPRQMSHRPCTSVGAPRRDSTTDTVCRSSKLSGIYEHHTFHKRTPLVRGFDDVFYVPHSRYTSVSKEDIVNNEHLEIVAESDVAGPYLIIGDGGKNIFVTGHPEYDVLTLDQEYHRDLGKGLNPQIPVNYYPDNDPEKKPVKKWRCHANTLYANWLNYYVYQLTPYKWE